MTLGKTLQEIDQELLDRFEAIAAGDPTPGQKERLASLIPALRWWINTGRSGTPIVALQGERAIDVIVRIWRDREV